MAALSEVLNKLLLPDNAVRHDAEQIFHGMMKESCEQTVIALFQIMANGQVHPAIRKLSAVLLRRNLVDTEDSVYFKLSQSR